MVNTQLLANFLTEELNKESKNAEFSYKFKIFAEIGEAAAGYINGIIRSLPGEVKPIKGYDEVKYAFDFDLAVPASRTNFIFIKTSAIVNKVIQSFNDTAQDFGTGKGIITFSSIYPQEFKQEYRIGDMIPLSVKIYITYTDYGTVTSSDKHWFFDGIEIPFLSESIAVQTEGITKKIATESYKKTLLTGQMRLYTFTVPHDSTIGKKFQELIFNYSLEKQYAVGQPGNFHKLKYYDGETFTEASPFETTVTLYQGAKSTSTRPNASTFEITFTDADDGEKYPKYFMGLIDFAFDNQSEDTRYFDSIAEQQQYFESKVAASAAFIQIVVPNLDSLDITNQIYPMGNYYTPFDIVNKNYAVIKYVSSAQAAPQYFYYFVTNAKIGADGQVAFDLHLDTVQTYFFRPTTSFADCLIERAHLNRFQPVTAEDVSSGENVDDYVKFVTDPATKIYNAEDALNYPKRLVKRTKLGLRPTGIDEVDNWLNDNVAYWVYVYVDPSREFNFAIPYAKQGIEEKLKIPKAKYKFDQESATSVFCYPIYKTNKMIKINGMISLNNEYKNFDIILSQRGFQGLEKYNKPATPYYYMMKISILPPFVGDTLHQGGYRIDEGNLIILETVNNINIENNNIMQEIKGDAVIYALGGGVLATIGTLGPDGAQVEYPTYPPLYGIFTYIAGNETVETFSYEYPNNSKRLKSKIKNAKGFIRESLNPKLNGQNFRELIISSFDGETFTYDFQKLQSDTISFLYTEPVQPEITKYYLRVKGGTGLYEKGTESNYTGLVGSTDNGLAFTNDQYAAFIANNKNFWMQSNMKIAVSTFKNKVNTVSDFLSAKEDDDYLAASKNAIFNKIDRDVAIMERNMTVDNMRNAPDQMKNANGNVIFNIAVTDLGLYVEEFSALDADLDSAFDFMELYGFSVNVIDNIKNYVAIRIKHNYVKAQLQSIYGNMSNIVRADLRQRFAAGIRFWNQDDVDYSTENYEKWLDDNNSSSNGR